MVYRTTLPQNDRLAIKRHDTRSMGINPIGLDYRRVEDIIAEIGPQLQVPHRHDYYEIIWFTNCHGNHMVEFVSYELRPSMLFFFLRNQIHAFLTTEGLQGHMLRSDEAFVKSLSSKGSFFPDHSLFKIHSSPIRYLAQEKIPVFQTLIGLIKNELIQKDGVHHLEMHHTLLKAFLIESERILPA